MNASSLNKEFKRAVVRSSIRPVEMRTYKQRDGSYKEEPYVELTFHDTRHAWAPWCLSNGMPPTAVMEWGGWEDAKTMSIHEHFIPNGFEVEMLNAAIDRESAAAPGVSGANRGEPLTGNADSLLWTLPIQWRCRRDGFQGPCQISRLKAPGMAVNSGGLWGQYGKSIWPRLRKTALHLGCRAVSSCG